MAKLLTTDELHKSDVSNVVEDCKFNLKKSCLINKPQSIQVFTACRDYIITSLILSNATRPGPLRNMTLKEFKNATISLEGVHMVSIKEHKTSSTSWHRVICFSKNLYKEYLHYVEMQNLLPGIGVSPSDPVFVSWAGRAMSSSLIGDQFASFFQRATACNLVERQSRKVTATLVRKSFVSKVHTEIPELKKDLANMMCHSKETASRLYFLQEKVKNVSKTFNKVQDTLHSEKNSELELREVFKDDTSSSKSITLDTARNKRNDLNKFPLSDTQIRYKLRYVQSKKRRVEPHEIDEEEYIPPTDQEDCSDTESSDESVTTRRSRVFTLRTRKN